MYDFSEVLNEEQIALLKKYNVPLECERNIDAVWNTIQKLTDQTPLTEEIEILADTLMDNI